tara:strand:- start:84 stop:1271 length:1188 start_codon:yes stop_codon:yes gene_type:complete
MNKKFKFPLMENNISKEDISKLISFLKKNPRLTAGKEVKEFEKKWSKWLGVKYSVFVNSGSSANYLTMAALRIFAKNSKKNDIIVPALTWNSDIVSVLKNSFNPIFIDIDLKTLSMDENKLKKNITKKTLAVFLTHAQGFVGISKDTINFLKKKKVLLIEDVCESHGANIKRKKCGTFGLASNFSFYFAHHMSTIEGGMICSNNRRFSDLCFMLRGHGLLRESPFKSTRNKFKKNNPDLNPQFIFTDMGYNFRNTEIGAVIGKNQINRLNKNILLRNKNFKIFLQKLNSKIFYKNFSTIGSSNYAFPVILKSKNIKIRNKFEKYLDKNRIEYRRGNAGGGNQLRQPYLKKIFNFKKKNFINTEHVHFFGYYLGNYPSLRGKSVDKLVNILNNFKY